MKSKVPKQFLTLDGIPVLMRTIKKFALASEHVQIIVTLPESQLTAWRKLCLKHDFEIPHDAVAGGKTRFHSVRNGLDRIMFEGGIVAIHDGVRPLVSTEIIEKSFDIASKTGNAIAAVPMKDSIRKNEKGKSRTVDRDNYWMIQTPQTFKVNTIKKAYEAEFDESFTDDASVLEASGGTVHLIPGDYKNIKITTPEDLVVAEAFLKQ